MVPIWLQSRPLLQWDRRKLFANWGCSVFARGLAPSSTSRLSSSSGQTVLSRLLRLLPCRRRSTAVSRPVKILLIAYLRTLRCCPRFPMLLESVPPPSRETHLRLRCRKQSTTSVNAFRGRWVRCQPGVVVVVLLGITRPLPGRNSERR